MELAQPGGAERTPYILVLVTVGSEEEASAIGRALVDQRLAACTNIVGGVKSIYRWQGKVTEDKEFLLMIKSRNELFDEITNTVKRLHSYELPEIIAIGIESGLSDYLHWIRDSTEIAE